MAAPAPVPITSISELCRICLATTSGGHALCDPLDEEAEDSPSIAEAVLKVLGCKLVPDEEYPLTVCYICKRNLLNAFYFRTIVVRSQEVLGEVLEDIKDVQQKFARLKSPMFSPKLKKIKLKTSLSGEGSSVGSSLIENQLLDSQEMLREAGDSSVARREDIIVVKGTAEEAGDVANINGVSGPQELSYWCSLCEVVLIGDSSLDLHADEHVRANMEMNETIKKQESANQALESHDHVFICDICDKEIESSQKYRNHLKFHGVRYLEKCDRCEKAFVHKTNLDHHKSIAHCNNIVHG